MELLPSHIFSIESGENVNIEVLKCNTFQENMYIDEIYSCHKKKSSPFEN